MLLQSEAWRDSRLLTCTFVYRDDASRSVTPRRRPWRMHASHACQQLTGLIRQLTCTSEAACSPYAGYKRQPLASSTAARHVLTSPHKYTASYQGAIACSNSDRLRRVRPQNAVPACTRGVLPSPGRDDIFSRLRSGGCRRLRTSLVLRGV